MSANNELRRLLDKAEVHPYRRVGRVRVAHNPLTPKETLDAALAAVRKFAPVLVDAWGEPDGNQVHRWREQGMTVAEVCDDPLPRDVDPGACPIAWLVERAARYHFRIVGAPPADIRFEGADGWSLKSVVPLLPQWYTDACKARRAEIVAHLIAQTASRDAGREPECSPEPSTADLEDESTATNSPTRTLAAMPIVVTTMSATTITCRVCGADATDPETRARLADPAHCSRGGATEQRSKVGTVVPAEARCPYKPKPE